MNTIEHDNSEPDFTVYLRVNGSEDYIGPFEDEGWADRYLYELDLDEDGVAFVRISESAMNRAAAKAEGVTITAPDAAAMQIVQEWQDSFTTPEALMEWGEVRAFLKRMEPLTGPHPGAAICEEAFQEAVERGAEARMAKLDDDAADLLGGS